MEIVAGDLLELESLTVALAGVQIAYHLRGLLLVAEMKIPGRLWLQFDVEGDGRRTELRQTTVFDPAGSVGLVYWYLLYPVHHTIVKAMLHGLNRATDPGPNGAGGSQAGARRDRLHSLVKRQRHDVVGAGRFESHRRLV